MHRSKGLLVELLVVLLLITVLFITTLSYGLGIYHRAQAVVQKTNEAALIQLDELEYLDSMYDFDSIQTTSDIERIATDEANRQLELLNIDN